MSVRACEIRRVEGRGTEYRGPPWRATGTEVPRAPKKNEKTGGGSTRADKKAGKEYFGGSEGAGEQKNHFGGSEKKNIIRAGAKKNSSVNENTTHRRGYVQ